MGQDNSKQEKQRKEYSGDQSATTPFEISGKQLYDLVGNKDAESYNKLGGTAGICKILKTDPSKGLDCTDLDKRYAQYGQNKYPDPVMKSFLTMVLESLNDNTIIILIASAVVSLFLAFVVPKNDTCGEEEMATDWIEGLAILCAVFVVSFGSSISDYSKQKKFLQLSKDEKNVNIKVVRKGENQLVSILELAVGDLVNLDVGDVIPADGIYASGYDLRVDESDMTGEPIAVRKSEKYYVMMSGTKITDGNGQMIVTSVGLNSLWGKTKESLSQDKPRPTPLQELLDKLAEQIGKLGFGCALIVFSILVVYWVIDAINYSDMVGFNWKHLTAVVDYLITAVTIVVVAVPEGLPLAVTISLAYSMKQMMKDNNLVRHLKACEIMSNCSNICTDKTGTLTENRMTVVSGWFGGETMERGKYFSLGGTRLGDEIYNNIAINKSVSTAVYEEDGIMKTIGNKTECALLGFVLRQHTEYIKRAENLAPKIYQQFAFSSARKRMSTLVFNEDKSVHMFLKGAPEAVLAKCSKYMKKDGSISDLTDVERKVLSDFQESCANQGMRTLSLAIRDLPPKDANNFEEKFTESPEEECVLLCVFGIEDPLRPEVIQAVADCHRAGITVRMVTGDNVNTGKSIAKQCKIVESDNDTCIEGPAFAKLTDEQIDDLLPTLRVIARCSPQDKKRLVNRLILKGEVVAVTGDGTNDVPALKEADVGLAMGIRGTDVAKQASDIVILDDNFNSIVKAVMWGRCVYDNIRKFLQFQLTVNVVALALCVIGAITKMGSPLKALQMLWVNMIMDTLAALALGTEKPTPSLLDRKPFGRKASLISTHMIRNIVVQATYQLFVLLFLLYCGRYITFLGAPCAYVKHGDFGKFMCADGELHSVGKIEKHTTIVQTMIFNAFVFCQIFNEINSRKVNGEKDVFENFFSNYMFVGIIAMTSVVQALIVVFAGPIFSVTPFPGINFVQWMFCLFLSAMSLVVGQFAIRFLPAEKFTHLKDLILGAEKEKQD
ncbi:cation-transporting ATPase, putative [Entamoeba invadens IP1]|uniref:Calcium-transporting ATPase n=1 Tax=Entamoeba invadens IP1 TaxID=370355 RepID=A0A0A1UH47_ENTIV|nr:cation-transporting ATPase, putative [Entamoeba invadens IP1]ELP94658.1 cation-transporting ATPase, putative [Entamoeba invadens IP1]|eukprot:XP_004261429.1 cation-transporting ATPase, putative [Entamoeba invadens IP1]